MPRPSPRSIYRYTDHFKATAVHLNELPGVCVADVAESLYIPPFHVVSLAQACPRRTYRNQGYRVGPNHQCRAQGTARSEAQV